MGDAGNIQAAGCYVGGYQDVDGAFLELAHHGVSLLLGQIAVEPFRHVAALLQRFGHFVTASLGADENDGELRILHVQEAAQGVKFLTVRQLDVFLFNEIDGYRSGFDFYDFRFLQESLCQFSDGSGHGSGEEHGLPFFRNPRQDGADVVDESHIHHFVPFVQHENLHVGQVDGAALHVVHETARGGYDDVRMFAERFELAFNVLAAVNRQRVNRQVLRQVVDFLSGLDRQLAGRRKDHRLGSRLGHVDAFQHRDAEGRGLAGAGLRLADQVFAG